MILSGRVAVSLVCVCALALAACQAGSSTPPDPTASAMQAGASGDGPPAPVAVLGDSGARAQSSPLSGRPSGTGKPVLIVKIDNTVAAQPHVGLDQADIVYIEEVEGGLSRLAAVYSSRLPPLVGPVRSARISDIDLVAQFGRPAMAFSGAQSTLLPLLAAAPFYEVSEDRGTQGYFRDPNRYAPVDLMGRPWELVKRAPNASNAKSIGFRFDATPPDGGRSARSVTASYPSSSARFVWRPTHGEYDVWLNSRPAMVAGAGQAQATTVVLQFVRESDSAFGDKFGGRTPILNTVGSGRALVLRDGRAWRVEWTRPDARSGTTFRTSDGKVLPFSPGQVWVALVNRNTPAVIG